MSAVVEDRNADSRLERVRKLLDKATDLAKAGDHHSLNEAEALNERAAELIAKYGIDEAMIAATGGQDEIVDWVMIVGKPFSREFTDLLWFIASQMRAKGRLIKRHNPDLHGGRSKGGWEYGLRLFAYGSDKQRIEMTYASLRNQAISGLGRIVDTTSQFGQTQKADRQSYLDGFNTAVHSRISRAEQAAKQAKEAEQEEARDLAMLEGKPVETGVELVLVERGKAVAVAMDKAYGISQADRERWARDAEQAQARRTEEWNKAKAECVRCSKGRACSRHGTARGRTRDYERVGNRWGDGYSDGLKADLGAPTGRTVGTGRSEITD